MVLGQVRVVIGHGLDEYMQRERGGSTGTTPAELHGPNEIRFKCIAFKSSAFHKNEISPQLAAEEFVQSMQYQNFADVFFGDPETASEVGFKSPEDFYYELTYGNLRAFLELIQQKFKYKYGVYENSYFFNVGGEIANEYGSPTSKATVNESFTNLVLFLQGVTGNRYEIEELMKASNLLEINREFKKKYGSDRNVWETVGMFRRGALMIDPKLTF